MEMMKDPFYERWSPTGNHEERCAAYKWMLHAGFAIRAEFSKDDEQADSAIIYARVVDGVEVMRAVFNADIFECCIDLRVGQCYDLQVPIPEGMYIRGTVPTMTDALLLVGCIAGGLNVEARLAL
tara:strand:- start:436 stop:810 length:375 start_codon:yes stop_codon:yes gene_type:complete